MAACNIGDVERLLGVKAHVLRYWEKEIPLLQPKKDQGGRRLYSEADLGLLLRLRYLLHTRRFTLEGAREQLLRERTGADQNARALIEEIRTELLRVYALVRKYAPEADDANPLSPP